MTHDKLDAKAVGMMLSFAGIGLLGEPLTLRLIISLTLVSIGIYIVNRK